MAVKDQYSITSITCVQPPDHYCIVIIVNLKWRREIVHRTTKQYNESKKSLCTQISHMTQPHHIAPQWQRHRIQAVPAPSSPIYLSHHTAFLLPLPCQFDFFCRIKLPPWFRRLLHHLQGITSSIQSLIEQNTTQMMQMAVPRSIQIKAAKRT